MIERNDLVKKLNSKLNIYDYDDYGPNGLQVEGNPQIKKIAFAVSATIESVQKAVDIGADALIVHHGLFWKFHGAKKLTGPFFRRVAPLIRNDINLLGYHLPLDGHIELGNAAGIAKELGMTKLKPFGDHKGMHTGVSGKLKAPIKPSDLSKELEGILGHSIIHSSPGDENISTLGIITGGANGDWRQAKSVGLDAYLTGEISEHDWHEAKEDGIHFFAGGHNATEQFGVQSLMKYIHSEYSDANLELFYIPSDNPA